MKKLFAIILALAMTFALSAVALAATPPTTGTITVQNPQANKTYDGYKIFDLKLTGESPYQQTYTIKGDTGTDASPWFSDVQSYANDTTTAHGLVLTQDPTDATLYHVTVTDVFSAADFAKYLNLHTSGKTADATTGVIPAATAPAVPEPAKLKKDGNENLPLGYWFVTSGAGSLCNLDTNNPNVVIYDKNDKPIIEKGVDNNNPQVGDTLTFEVKGKVPDTTGYSVYWWIVTDTMSEGLRNL